jgi:hypothetical protein
MLRSCALLGLASVAAAAPEASTVAHVVIPSELRLSAAERRDKMAAILRARPSLEKKTSVAERTETQVRAALDDTAVHYVTESKFVGGTGLDGDPLFISFGANKGHQAGETRCGFSWDDAAVKCGPRCHWNSDCPRGTWTVADGKDEWGNPTDDPFTEKIGMCYADIPFCDGSRASPMGKCLGIVHGVTDAWCMQVSRTIEGPDSVISTQSFLDQCVCEEVPLGLNTPTESNPNPVIKKKEGSKERSEYKDRWDLRQRDDDGGWKLQESIARYHESGLQFCTWRPQLGGGKVGAGSCTNTSFYECMEGPKQGYCSENWLMTPKECKSWCVHELLITLAPYYPVWRYGPRAFPWKPTDRLPHYAMKDALNRGDAVHTPFEHPRQVLMSTYCKSKQIAFVGVSLFSPKYETKARRLLSSCNLAGVCCKATEIAPDAYGRQAPEGSEEFRFRTIALKPIFILDQLEKTEEPVVFLDVDLEFHQFPKLFLPGSWPDTHPRDVALFNFWANETNITQRHTPNVGSAVAYFNQTYRSKKLLTAWAEAMRYGTNNQAPDDQVLDKLLREGGWLVRASVGWLPVSYLRTMPAYYRGIDPVIDHDRGVPPGMIAHSTTKPQLPPVLWSEPVDTVELEKQKEAPAS